MNIDQLIESHLSEFQGFRYHIHANPELSFEEVNTSAYIASVLDSYQIPYSRVCGTGIVAEIHGAIPSDRCLAMRSDLDALPILEQNDVKYKSSVPGVMHACGHDVHTACLLSAAIIIQEMKEELKGTIKFIFQPGEEKHPGGASLMIKEGVLEKVNAIVALHVYPHLPAGTYGFREGQYMASTDEVYIHIQGTSGHAAMPHLSVDPITIAAEMIMGMQTIISRKKNPIYPSVLTFGKIEGGTAPNVIPQDVYLEGTLRCMNEDWRYEAHKWIKDYGQSIAQSWGATAEVDVVLGYPSLYNNIELTRRCKFVLEETVGDNSVVDLELRMTGEDFSFYTHHVPGCFFRLGTNKDNKEYTTPVHNSRFDINMEAIRYGVKAFVELAYRLDVEGLSLNK